MSYTENFNRHHSIVVIVKYELNDYKNDHHIFLSICQFWHAYRKAISNSSFTKCFLQVISLDKTEAQQMLGFSSLYFFTTTFLYALVPADVVTDTYTAFFAFCAGIFTENFPLLVLFVV